MPKALLRRADHVVERTVLSPSGNRITIRSARVYPAEARVHVVTVDGKRVDSFRKLANARRLQRQLRDEVGRLPT